MEIKFDLESIRSKASKCAAVGDVMSFSPDIITSGINKCDGEMRRETERVVSKTAECVLQCKELVVMTSSFISRLADDLNAMDQSIAIHMKEK